MPLIIAVYQGGFNDVNENLTLLEETITKNKIKNNIDLFIFSELFITGYVVGKKFEELAESSDGKWFQKISQIAKENQVGIVYGYPERYQNKIYNSAMLIDATGKCLLNYRKTHLWGHYEKSHFEFGSEFQPTVEFKGWKVNLLVCYDIEFVEPCRILSLNGAQLIIVPTANTTQLINDVTVLSRAYENNVFVVYANRVGPERCNELNKTIRFCGRSAIVAPNADVLARGSDTEPCLIIAELLFDKTEYIEKQNQNQYMQDRRPQFYTEIAKCE